MSLGHGLSPLVRSKIGRPSLEMAFHPQTLSQHLAPSRCQCHARRTGSDVIVKRMVVGTHGSWSCIYGRLSWRQLM